MTLPNFFIVGAAKAGTSSIFNYLTQHPDIYRPPIKEPSYFALGEEKIEFKGPGDDVFNKTIVKRYDDYMLLFDGAKNEKMIGEASVVYLHSKRAALQIKNYIPNAKIIIILREPVERAISSYSHKVRDGFESLDNIEDAIDAEEERRLAGWQHIWQYKALGYYYDAVKRYITLFPGNVAVYLYDDLKKNPSGLLKNIFDFLDVDNSFEPNIQYKYNVSGRPRSKIIHKFLSTQSSIKNMGKIILPEKLRSRIRGKIQRYNIDPKKPIMKNEYYKYMKRLYREDIKRTQEIIGRDLSAWLD